MRAKQIIIPAFLFVLIMLFFGCTQFVDYACEDGLCLDRENVLEVVDELPTEIQQQILESELLENLIEERISEEEITMAPPPEIIQEETVPEKVSISQEVQKRVARHRAKTTSKAKPSAKTQKPDLTNKTIVIYNSNDTEALELAKYYATARSIPGNRICEVQLPPGESASAKHLLAARKSIIECMCDIIEDDAPGTIPSCDYTKYDEVAGNSSITHMAIIKGIPNIVYDTNWYVGLNTENPSFDFYLATTIYTDGNIFYSGGSTTANANYVGYAPDYIDFQSGYAEGYSREIIPALDRVLAYGRIEAINLERTKQLIDKTIAAEEKGFQGNILMERADSSSPQRQLNKKLLELYTGLVSQHKEECFDYLEEPYGTWDSDVCRLGISLSGDYPGEIIPPWRTGVSAIQTTPKAINTGFFSGINPWPNGQTGFDSFKTMLNWRKDVAECTPLCRNLATEALRTECEINSTDYFKELNTDCVGGAEGMIGHQVRSFPVQYYGFYPQTWVSSSAGIFEVTPPLVLEGDAFQNERFTDNKYLHLGSVNKVANPSCELVDGTSEDCVERIGVNMAGGSIVQRGSIFLEPEVNKKFKTKFRLRGDTAKYLNLVITYRFYENAFLNSDGDPVNFFTRSTRLKNLSLDDTWREFEVEFDLNNELVRPEFEDASLELYTISLSFWAIKQHGIYNFLDFDGIEIIGPGEEDLLPIENGSFVTGRDWTTNGDTAANAIDRLGAIAWWGSSSHHVTGGWAFKQDDTFTGSFFSGRTLGESLIKQLRLAMSGIIYGDPIYNPSGVKLFVNDGLSPFGWDDSRWRYSFNEDSESEALDLYINAFHGTNNLNKTNWSVSVCYDENNWVCDAESSWEEIEKGNKAVFEYNLKDNLLDLVENKSIDSNLILWIKMWNPGEEEKALSNYGYASFVLANCGNKQVDGGENCDGLKFGSDSCKKRGYAGGALTCSKDCQTITEEKCKTKGCGNGIVEEGEICDPPSFGHAPSCIVRGYAGGVLTCSDECKTVTEENCIEKGCGNGIQDDGEYCDVHAAQYYESCVQEGFCGGESICKTDCSEFDFTDCFDFDDARCEQDYHIDLNLEKNKEYYLTLPILPLNKDIRDIVKMVPFQTTIYLRKNNSWKSAMVPFGFGPGRRWSIYGTYEDLSVGIGKGFTIKPKLGDLNLTIFGKPFEHPQKILINGEYSLIGIPFCNELYDSNSLIRQLNSVDENCTKIEHRNSNGEQYYYSLDDSFKHKNGIKNIFPIDNNTSYWIYCDSDTNFEWKPKCGTIKNFNPTSGIDLFVNDQQFTNRFFKTKGKIKIKKAEKQILELEHDFANGDLDLNQFEVVTGKENEKEYTIIKNLNADTKTIFVDKNVDSGTVCLLDEEITDINYLKENCVEINCPGTSGDITCEVDEDTNQYKISGLTHSGVIGDYGYCGDGNCSTIEDNSSCSEDCPIIQCTSTTYSDWSTCTASRIQIKTLISKEPANCSASVVLTQACTYTPPGDNPGDNPGGNPGGGTSPPADTNRCSTISDCGTNGYIGDTYCNGNNIVRKYQTWTCESSECESSEEEKIIVICSNCAEGACVNDSIACTIDSDCETDYSCENSLCKIINCNSGYEIENHSCVCNGTICGAACYHEAGVCCDNNFVPDKISCVNTDTNYVTLWGGTDFASIFNFFDTNSPTIITEEDITLLIAIVIIVIVFVVGIVLLIKIKKKKPKNPFQSKLSPQKQKEALLKQLRNAVKK
jgi:hypothetical protein